MYTIRILLHIGYHCDILCTSHGMAILVNWLYTFILILFEVSQIWLRWWLLLRFSCMILVYKWLDLFNYHMRGAGWLSIG